MPPGWSRRSARSSATTGGARRRAARWPRAWRCTTPSAMPAPAPSTRAPKHCVSRRTSRPKACSAPRPTSTRRPTTHAWCCACCRRPSSTARARSTARPCAAWCAAARATPAARSSARASKAPAGAASCARAASSTPRACGPTRCAAASAPRRCCARCAAATCCFRCGACRWRSRSACCIRATGGRCSRRRGKASRWSAPPTSTIAKTSPPSPRSPPRKRVTCWRRWRHAFPALRLTAADAVSSFAGVRPVVDDGAVDPSRASREHVVRSEHGLVTVTGGKLTTFRPIALAALAEAGKRLPALRGIDAAKALAGAPILDAVEAGPAVARLPLAQRSRLLGRHGRRAEALVAEAGADELLPVPGTATLWAELSLGAASRAGPPPRRPAAAPHPPRPAAARRRRGAAAAPAADRLRGARLVGRGLARRVRALFGHHRGPLLGAATMNATAASARERPGDLLLAIDCGTQSVRVLLFDLDGALVAKSQLPFDDYRSRRRAGSSTTSTASGARPRPPASGSGKRTATCAMRCAASR